VSSWYFGDGANLLNEVNAPSRVVGTISPMDPVLNALLAERRNGGSLGVRFGRLIKRRLKAELSVNYSSAPLEIGDHVARAIEATRDSFKSVWARRISLGLIAAPGATSVTTIDNGNARQIFVDGTINFTLTQPRRFTPYATVGGGVLAQLGDTPGVTVSGSYEFRSRDLFTISERDNVTVRYSAPTTSFVGVVGAGFTYDVLQRSGVRVDVRAHLGPSRSMTTVSAHPEVVAQTPNLLLVFIGGASEEVLDLTSPSIQFSNNTHPLSLHHSTLTGPDIVDFVTFTSTGVQMHLGVTAGWYWRF
jgi:hypothetical protein